MTVPYSYNHETGQFIDPTTGFPVYNMDTAGIFQAMLGARGPQNPQGFNFPITMPQIPQANQTPFASMLAPLPAPPAINFQPQAIQSMQSPQLNLAGLPQVIQDAVPAYLKGGVR